jgi:uncharacterized membrane protein (UPF0127 family)
LRSFNLQSSVFLKLIFLPAFSFVILTSCQAQERGGRGRSQLESFSVQELTIESQQGQVKITAELAVTEAQRAQGLMHRTELKDGHGMLFVFERDQIMSFWMKDTLVPLSIAYILSSGRIIEIYDMQPGNLNAVTSSRSARYALEVPQGWFERAGIARGDMLDTANL